VKGAFLKPKNKTRRRAGGSAFSVKLFNAVRKGIIHSFLYVLSLTLIGVLVGSVVAYALNAPVFELQEVKILNVGTLTPEQSFAFSELHRGENLVNIDLAGVQQVVKAKHPEFKEVIVRRILPNRIEISLKRRTPVAQVSFSRFIQVDKDLVLLPGSSPTPFRNLTIIEGGVTPREGLFVGVALRDIPTLKALKLLELIRRSNVLGQHALTKIDIRDPRNISFYVDEGIEVRIGSGHFAERLKILDQTLRSVDLDISKIRYIDLRFDNVVVGPR